MKISVLDRIFLLLTGILAAYQIAIGIDQLSTFPIIVYTIGFGVLLIAALLILILGFEILDSPVVVIVSTIIPLCVSLGLVWEYMLDYRILYLLFAMLGFLAIILTRLLPMRGITPLVVLAIVHGVAGLIIFILPILWVINRHIQPGFALIGVGGALISVGGILLSLLKAGKPILSRQIILKVLPILLLIMTAAFVAGFSSV